MLGIASDPGPTERVAARTLVGDAGQRVQGFLSKLGLSRSYLLLNAFPYALHPSRGDEARELLARSDQVKWRNRLYDAARNDALQAIVTFGGNARIAIELWPGKPDPSWSRSRTRAAATAQLSSQRGERRSPSCAAS